LPHETPLITTLVAGFGLAFVFGLLAQRLKLPLIAGYLLAGVVIGPFTPGYVADMGLATELAELGVILLMFGVGLHFSPRDLMAVKAIAVPGAIGQILVATAFGTAMGWALGWGIGAALIFGLALSVASTVVLLRALQDRDLVTTDKGRVAVGWLIVEDLVMVLSLVLIPPLGRASGRHRDAGGGRGRGGGRSHQQHRDRPDRRDRADHAGQGGGLRRADAGHRSAGDPLGAAFRLADPLARAVPASVLAIALGVAYGATYFFGVSFALGAFFAGMVMSSSTLSQQAMRETLPLRDAFAVLFFVSVGMLFNPSVILTSRWR
jgi:CPA2 family monovalent cation:H+ antiporter-2